MGNLTDAIHRLVSAKPDIEKVEALTEETIKRRETPYELGDLFGLVPYADGKVTATCKLCAATVTGLYQMARYAEAQEFGTHLGWHNNLERRLQALENGG